MPTTPPPVPPRAGFWLERLHKAYGLDDVLRIEGLHLPPGLHVLRGSNGAGKSTLLKALAGLLPFEGRLYLEGRACTRRKPTYLRAAVNWAEAEPIFPPFVTGMDLVKLLVKTKSGTREQAQGLLHALGANTFIDRQVGVYSSGMLKKLALVLAFVGRPKWILLDEPFITLDAQSLPVLVQLIAQRQAHGCSFLLATHTEEPLATLHVSHYWRLEGAQVLPDSPPAPQEQPLEPSPHTDRPATQP